MSGNFNTMGGGGNAGGGGNNNNNNSWVPQAATGLGTGILGMIGAGRRAKKQHRRQKELMGIQFANQQALNEQGQKLQMQTWRETGYPAQMKMMKEAGLNPALMYGMSGGGGQTTGSQGGGSAASGQAHAPMELGSQLQAGMQAAMMKAQIDNINADTEQKKADANLKDKTIGQIASNIRNMDANTERTNQLKEFEQYEQDMKKKGIYPNDGKFWRMLSNNISEEEIEKLTKAFVGTLQTPLHFIDKFGKGVEWFIEWIFGEKGIDLNIDFNKSKKDYKD